MLIVDDFGVGYENNEHALHLLQTLHQYYEAVSVDWTGTLYCGITLKWDYGTRTCELSMPGYVQHALHKFHTGVEETNKATDAPHLYKATKKQGLPMTPAMDDGAKLSRQAIKQLQQIVGTFLFYSRAVNPTKAKAAALFTNMKEGVIQCIALEEMQWPQPPTPITVDNSTAAGVARDTIKANKSQAMDMCLHWIQDQAQQRQFLVTWAPGKLNKADYFTKLHAPIHHWHMRFVYLHPTSSPTNPAHLSQSNLSCGGVLNPGVKRRVTQK